MEFSVNELKAVAKATRVLQSETDGADGQTYLLFLQHFVAIAQPASRISGIMSLVLALMRVVDQQVASGVCVS